MSEADAAIEASGAAGATRVGRTLAEARATRNLSVAEVAQQLKLSATQVEALEADAYDRLPGPVFVRGFVRNYARLLELDVETLVSQVELPRVTTPATAAIPLSRNIPFPEQGRTNWLPYAALLTLVIGAVLVFEVFLSAPPAVVVSPVAPKIAAEPVVVAQPVSLEKEATVPAAPQPEAAAVVAGPVVAPVPAPVPAAAAAPQQNAAAELHFVFDASSWVEVRDRNGRILFSQLNPAKTEHRMQARRPLNLVIGNAQGVRLSYNGQPFDLAPHTPVEVARFTLE